LKAVRVIPAKKNHTLESKDNNSKKRVAAYARVSTNFDEQQTSFDAQLNYYSKYIKSKPEWEFVKVYSDEGISGTSTKKRKGFNNMIEDSIDGKID